MNPRVTAPMRKAAAQVLASIGTYSSHADIVEAICEAVITAEDSTTRYVIGARDQRGNTTVYGPYATANAAIKAAASGIGYDPGMAGFVLPLCPAPKKTKAQENSKQQSLI